MSAKVVKSDQEEAEEKQARDDCARIVKKVMARLGRPPGFVNTLARQIRLNTYRVNVYVEEQREAEVIGMLTRRIAHSYFVQELPLNDDLVSNPLIEKLY